MVMFYASVVFGQEKPIIAVYVVSDNADNDETKAIKNILETRLIEAFTRSNLFTATERSEVFLAQINKEINYQQSGRVRDDQLTVLAKNSGAKYLCIADIVEVFGEKFVKARLIETESNNITGNANSSGAIKSMTDLTTICSEVAHKLISSTPQGKTKQTLTETKKREGTYFYIVNKEDLFSKKVEVVANKVKAELAAKGCSFTEYMEDSDFILRINATTRLGNEEYCSWADVEITLFDNHKQKEVYGDTFAEKAFANPIEKAGKNAMEKVALKISEKLTKWIQ